MSRMNQVLHDKIQDLDDLELAIIVSLVAGEHCIVSTNGATEELRDEIEAVARHRFNLRCASIQCTAKTTVDELNETILVPADETDNLEEHQDYHHHLGLEGSDGARPRRPSNVIDNRQAADVVVACDLDLASDAVQVQVLEILKARRFFTRTAMHTAPRGFLFVAVLSHPDARLTKHLHDLFATSHFIDEVFDGPRHMLEVAQKRPVVFPNEIEHLRNLVASAHMTAEVAAYLHNVVLFLRLSRYITAGVTPAATMHLRHIAQALAPLHGLDYVPPSLVALAARKVYSHRLVLATAETERSLQWGSDPRVVKQMLDGVTAEEIIERVLAETDSPL